jgi:ubiquinone/menaquinone biosynthesis C-methylase UbiE
MAPSPREAAEAYDSWYEGLSDGGDEPRSPWHLQIQPLFGNLRGKRVLEVGCGQGEFSLWLAGRDPTVLVGADLSGVAVSRAKERTGSRAAFIVSDIQQMPFPDEAFDVVVSCETVEHVPNPQLAVRELARVLRPGGTLVLTTPNYLNAMGLYRIYLRLRGRRFTEVGQPINQLTSIPRSIFWLRRAGVSPSRLMSLGHYLPWPGRPPLRFLQLDRPSPPWRWLGHHSVFVPHKPDRRV